MGQAGLNAPLHIARHRAGRREHRDAFGLSLTARARAQAPVGLICASIISHMESHSFAGMAFFLMVALLMSEPMLTQSLALLIIVTYMVMFFC
jgi:hypothetical protein